MSASHRRTSKLKWISSMAEPKERKNKAFEFQKRTTDTRKRLISSHKREHASFGPVCAVDLANNEKRCHFFLCRCVASNDTVRITSWIELLIFTRLSQISTPEKPSLRVQYWRNCVSLQWQPIPLHFRLPLIVFGCRCRCRCWRCCCCCRCRRSSHSRNFSEYNIYLTEK